MSDMKCPFCQQELLLSSFRDGDKDNEIWNCLHCQIGGQRKLWQELIRTHKALEVAVDALKVYASPENWDFEHFYSLDTHDIADKALEKITALEQKDVK